MTLARNEVTSPAASETGDTVRAEPFPWDRLIWFSALLIALYAPVLYAMANEWFTDDEMSHGVLVPLVAGYIVWSKRAEIPLLETRASWWGLVLVIWGFCQLVLGVLGVELFVSRTAFLVSAAGVIWTVGGVALLRFVAFPFFLLLFMIRIPQLIYGQITFPLQLLASSIAEVTLSLLGVPVFREGNVLELASQKLAVVEACSGIRSLLSLTFLSLVYGYFFEERRWVRPVLVVATVPIALAANASRVTITGILSEYKTELAQGIYHSFEGWVIFLVALVALIAFHQVLNKVLTYARK